MSLNLELEKLLPKQQEYGSADVTDHEDDEDEALSLCDLPVSKPNKDEKTNQEAKNGEVDDFAFDFGSLIGSIPALESDMCVADEVFSGGQMLPFRHSVSSESGLSRFRVPNRFVSRTGSMDRTRFGSCSSSRSSSTRSHQSNSSSTSTTTSNSDNNSSNSNSRGLRVPKPRNQFYSYPSPNARVRNTSGGRISTSTMSYGSKSTMWQVLRLGLVRTPEIELQGRTNNTYINKSSKKNSVSKIGELLSNSLMNDEKNRGKGNDSNGGFFKSCKCAVGAIEPLAITRINGNSSPSSSKSLASQVLNEDRPKKDRHGKQRLSNHRTFEWLRDLSHPNILNA